MISSGSCLSRKLKVVSYNIRHCVGTDRRLDVGRVAGVLQQTGGELIGLQEVDKHIIRSCFCDQSDRIGRILGFGHVFGPAVKLGPFGQYGNAIISRWPVSNTYNCRLPGGGEGRGLLEAEISWNGTKIAFFSTHLGLRQKDRLLQVEEVLSVIKEKNRPSILVGDFNADRDSREYSLATEVLMDATGLSGGFCTYPSESPRQQVDFIFLSRHWVVADSRPVISCASDHLAVVADIFLP